MSPWAFGGDDERVFVGWRRCGKQEGFGRFCWVSHFFADVPGEPTRRRLSRGGHGFVFRPAVVRIISLPSFDRHVALTPPRCENRIDCFALVGEAGPAFGEGSFIPL